MKWSPPKLQTRSRILSMACMLSGGIGTLSRLMAKYMARVVAYDATKEDELIQIVAILKKIKVLIEQML
ncbi:hypothetical protein [Candidatus Electronema sp. JM]|uniref:hypothetical protein n=1 Tax=Candidatus Electronema sp. JM TaxID=3401571 RepID=UPI003AA8435C